LSDILQGFFEGQDKNINQKKFKNHTILDDPILVKKGKPFITILCEVPLTNKQLYGLELELANAGLRDNYQIVSALKLIPTEKDLSKEIVKFYVNNKFNLSEVIPPWTNVISIGRSIYSILESDDLYIDGFKDTLLWNTSFYSPDLKCIIFPVNSFIDWYKKDNFEYFFFKKQVELAQSKKCKPFRTVKLKKHFVENPNRWLLDRKDKECLVAWDLETKGLNPWFSEGKILCLTIAFDSKEGYYLPWNKIDVNILSDFFRNKKHIGTNLKYDQRWVVSRGVDFDSLVNLEWDTMHASHTINEMQRNGLKSDTWLYTPYGGYDRALDRYKETHPSCKGDYSKIPFDLMFEYATQDPIMSFAAYEKQKKIVELLDKKYPTDNNWSLMQYLREIRFPACVMYADIEIKGMMINREELDKSSIEIRKELKETEDKVYEFFNTNREDLNIHSNDALGKFIEKNTDWRIDERNKKGLPLVGSPQLKRWAKQGHDGAQIILEMKEKNTLYKNFIGADPNELRHEEMVQNTDDLFSGILDDSIDSILTEESVEGNGNGYYQYIGNDDKIHGSFIVMMADSHRNKSRNPNLQNQPSHGDKAFTIRKNISCPKGSKFLSADYSGLQLRIAAILSGDPEMRKVFTELGGDMHSMTAQSVIMNNSISLEEFIERKKEEEISEARFRAKSINFSLLFGTSAFSFAHSSIYDEWSVEDAKAFVHENDLFKVVLDRQKRLRGEHNPDGIKDDVGNLDDFYKDIGDKNHFANCWAIASYLRRNFFNQYSVLEEWIKQCVKEAEDNGFIRSVYGTFRRLPELFYIGKDTYQPIKKNKQNVAINSRVQTFEAVVVNRWLLKIWNSLRQNKMKSYIFGNIHDAGEFISNNDEEEKNISLIKEEGNKDYPEYNGIPLMVECNLADYWGTYKTDNWEVWDMGQEV